MGIKRKIKLMQKKSSAPNLRLLGFRCREGQGEREERQGVKMDETVQNVFIFQFTAIP
jgi:hypothetical protein